MTWTPIEREIMEVLCCKVRIFSAEQMELGWRLPDEELARIVTRLTNANLVRFDVWQVVKPNIRAEPAFTWKPGHPSPDAWLLSKQFRGRWQRRAERVVVFQATEFAGTIFGARTGHAIRVYQQRHDLLLSEVYLVYKQYLPKLAETWVGENALPIAQKGVKNPDAFLIDQEGVARRVIESAGSYSQHQVESFHEYCRVARLTYELW